MVNEVRICELSTCRIHFKPKRYWQLCCCKKHGERLRYLRRKERLKGERVAIEILRGESGGS